MFVLFDHIRYGAAPLSQWACPSTAGQEAKDNQHLDGPRCRAGKTANEKDEIGRLVHTETPKDFGKWSDEDRTQRETENVG